jgi:4'-phosphopantetheinyl transferase
MASLLTSTHTTDSSNTTETSTNTPNQTLIQPVQVTMINVEEWKPTPAQVEALIEHLQPEEKARVSRFRLEIDKHRSLAGRILLRWMTNKMLNYPWKDLKFKRTEESKPYLFSPKREGYNFNVSHHGKWVAGACDTRTLVGVDVMKYERPRGCKSIPEFFDTMRQYFTKYEWNNIEKEPRRNTSVSGETKTAAGNTNSDTNDKTNDVEMLQLRQFYKNWALKESYIKAVGIGLGFELSRAEFRYVNENMEEVPDSNTSVMYIDGILKKSWSFDIYEPDHEHCVVVSMGPFKEATPHFLNVLTIPNEAHESDVVAEVDLPKIKFEILQFDSLVPVK